MLVPISGVSLQISINLGKTFLRISSITKIDVTWILASVFAYLPSFILQILETMTTSNRYTLCNWRLSRNWSVTVTGSVFPCRLPLEHFVIAICTTLPRQFLRPVNAWYFYTDITAGSNGNFGGKTRGVSGCQVYVPFEKSCPWKLSHKHCKNPLGV